MRIEIATALQENVAMKTEPLANLSQRIFYLQDGEIKKEEIPGDKK